MQTMNFVHPSAFAFVFFLDIFSFDDVGSLRAAGVLNGHMLRWAVAPLPSELEEVVCGQQTGMSGGELRCEHGTEGESLSVVGGVSDLNHVGFGIVGQRVDARHLSFADGIDAEFVRGAVFASAHRSVGISHFSLCPAAFAVKTGADLRRMCPL